MSKRICVTGSSGFIGSALCKKLSIPKESRFDIINSPDDDVTKEATQRRIASYDTIIHLAAISGIKACGEDKVASYLVNTLSVIQLMNMIRKNPDKRIIFASSSSVYGETSEYRLTESHPTNPRSEYGKQKEEAESTVRYSSCNWIILRKSNVYGEGIFHKGYNVIDKFITNYISRKSITMSGDGSQKRDFVDVMDIVNLYAKIAQRDKCRSGIYNVGGPETLSVRSIAEMVNDIGESVFSYRVPIETDNDSVGTGWHDFKYDWSKARMEFMYEPKFTIDDYIKRRMMETFRDG